MPRLDYEIDTEQPANDPDVGIMQSIQQAGQQQIEQQLQSLPESNTNAIDTTQANVMPRRQ